MQSRRPSFEERRKALFLREYRALCEKYGLMVLMTEISEDCEGRTWKSADPDIEINPDRWLAFTVGGIKAAPEALTAAIEEMLIESVFHLDNSDLL